MAFIRSYVMPFVILLVFLVAMLAVSARIFLPSDMMAPAPIEDMEVSFNSANLSSELSAVAGTTCAGNGTVCTGA